jgi:integrase
VVQALKAWKAQQATDRLAWGRDWTDTGLVFTREDGTAVPGQWISVRFETLAYRAGLPRSGFHDLRHGAASLYKAAGVDTKPISAMLGQPPGPASPTRPTCWCSGGGKGRCGGRRRSGAPCERPRR